MPNPPNSVEIQHSYVENAVPPQYHKSKDFVGEQLKWNILKPHLRVKSSSFCCTIEVGQMVIVSLLKKY